MLEMLGMTTSGLAAAAGDRAHERLSALAQAVSGRQQEAEDGWGRVDGTRSLDWDSPTADMYRLRLDEKKPLAQEALRHLEQAELELRRAAEDIRQQMSSVAAALHAVDQRLDQAVRDVGTTIEQALHTAPVQDLLGRIPEAVDLAWADQVRGAVGAAQVGVAQ